MLRLWKTLFDLADLDRHRQAENKTVTPVPDLVFDSDSSDMILPTVKSLQQLLIQRVVGNEENVDAAIACVKAGDETLVIRMHADCVELPDRLSIAFLASVRVKVSGMGLGSEYSFIANGSGESDREAIEQGIRWGMQQVVCPILATRCPSHAQELCAVESFNNKFQEPWVAYYKAVPQHIVDDAPASFSFSEFLSRTHGGFMSDKHLNVLRILKETVTDDEHEYDAFESNLNQPFLPQEEICEMDVTGWPDSAIPYAAPSVAFLQRRCAVSQR